MSASPSANPKMRNTHAHTQHNLNLHELHELHGKSIG